MKRLFATLTLAVFMIYFFPSIVLASNNYGDGNFGLGEYNVGEVATTTSDSPPTTVGSSTLTPACNQSVTNETPNLFEIRTTKNAATLYFTPPPSLYSYFYIAYSTKSDSWQYGTQNDQSIFPGVLRYTVQALAPNTKYYFKIRPGNGCATGNWGNIMTATTTSSAHTKTFYKNTVTGITNKTKTAINNLFPGKNTSQSQSITMPKPTTIQDPTQELKPRVTPSPKSKFCIFRWCF